MKETHSSNTHPSHPSAAERPNYDDINVPVVVMVGIVSAILTYWTVVLVQGITYQMQNNFIRERSYDVQYVKSVDAIERQKMNLAANDTGRVSIEDAMESTLKEYSQAPPR